MPFRDFAESKGTKAPVTAWEGLANCQNVATEREQQGRLHRKLPFHIKTESMNLGCFRKCLPIAPPPAVFQVGLTEALTADGRLVLSCWDWRPVLILKLPSSRLFLLLHKPFTHPSLLPDNLRKCSKLPASTNMYHCVSIFLFSICVKIVS